MKNILAFGVVFAILMFSGFSRGETTVAFAFGDGYRMSAPETVTNGIPVNWFVCITNTRATASRVDVAAEVAAIGYDGSLIAELFRSATTNVLEVGEFRRLSFALPSDWVPTGAVGFDLIEFSVGISLRDENRFSANWIRAEYVGETNIVDGVE
ncbi:MAG: hypothetical protein ACI4QT_08465 [Kiritimatiellia bacterium]